MLTVNPQKIDTSSKNDLHNNTPCPGSTKQLVRSIPNDPISDLKSADQLLASKKQAKNRKSAAAEIIQDINRRAMINGEVKFQEGTLETFGYDSITDEKEELELVDVLNFPKIKLITVKCLPNFKNLTILRLPNNFLSKVNEIQYLENLIWLDLNSNQIQSFPRSRYFWRNLQNLLVLNLHENLFESYLDIQSVSAIKNLTALTVYNTPMSVDNAIQINVNQNKNVVNYRHQLVNSCFNLKALDHHIISDEEIIEHLIIDSKFSKFKTLSENLRISLCPKCESVSESDKTREQIESLTYTDLQKILDDIDLKIKHVSPVQIIQRWTRGFLARKRLGKVLYKKELQQKDIMNVRPSNTNQKKQGSSINNISDLMTLDDLTAGPGPMGLFGASIGNEHLFDLSNLEFDDIVPELPPSMPRKITVLKSIPSKEYFDVSHSYLTNSAPFTSRAPSAKIGGQYNGLELYGMDQKSKADLDWFIHLLEKLQHEIEKSEKFQRIVPKSSLVKSQPKKYDSFPLQSDEDTQKWIEDRNDSTQACYFQQDDEKDLHFFRNQSLEIVGKISKFFNSRGDTSEEHTEREDLLHLAKIHKQQMAHLDNYIRDQREDYIQERKEKCQVQKNNEAVFHKNKSLAIKENMAMLSAIKPILRIARERQNEAKLHALHNKKEVINFTRFQEAKHIEDHRSVKSVKADNSKETEKFEQALISLALNDNQRRDKLYTEFARKRALIWRMKAKAAKDTINAGRKFAAETASLSRNLTKENFDCMKEKKNAEKNNLVKVHREDRQKRQDKIKIFKENSKLVRQINEVNDQIRGLNQTGVEKEKIYKMQKDRRQSRLDQLHADFVMEPVNDSSFLSPRNGNRRGSMFFVGQWMNDPEFKAVSEQERPGSAQMNSRPSIELLE